ncbi:cytochrome P450 [Rickenella mellea]|uniref:Cytochrome P450 n=1 Tax=Rickenella mellea TaxID=50990 RepID=A0A4R5XDB8_9AGAM|nr:cytochrome P450 [Rickenella mellea]
MTTNMVYALDVLAVAFSVLWLRSWLRSRRRNPRGLPLPPGPKRVPIIGNVIDMPLTDQAATIFEWGEKYGDMIYVEIIGQPMLFLNAYTDAVELLDKRSLWYSDRPTFPMSGELLDCEWLPVMIRYDERFKTHRQFMHRHCQAKVCHNYLPTQTKAARTFIRQLLDKPHDCERHARRAAAATIMMAAYGHESKNANPNVGVPPNWKHRKKLLWKETITWLSLTEPWNPGHKRPYPENISSTSYRVKYVPAWFPGAQFKKGRQNLEPISKGYAYRGLWNDNAKNCAFMILIVDGTARQSMMSGLVEICTRPDGTIRDEDIISACTAVCYGAGTDTTAATMMSFILALLLYPDVQTRGQEEIDRVIGHGRLPTFDDRDKLPYIEGIVREALRWNPVLPLIIPHRSMKDDFYKGYFIPAGTQVIVNHWAISHNEVEYPDPARFWPERWMPGGCSENSTHPAKVAFGFGRRYSLDLSRTTLRDQLGANHSASSFK